MAAIVDYHRPAAHVEAPADTTVRPILAERYKTKMCRNFIQQGMCPYESRCMFAHGEAELRTKDMNLQDGLVTEEAIRNFRRSMTPPHHDYQQQQQQYHGHQHYANCYCQECAAQQYQHQQPEYYSYEPYAYNAGSDAPCDCEDCRLAAQSPPCQCPDCVPSVVQHQPYRSPAVSYKQPQAYRRSPYNNTAPQMP